MGKKVILLFVCLLALGAGIGFYFTPHIAVYNMKKAAENKDAEVLSDYVDYPSLRESLKANFNAMMAGEIAKSKNESPFEAFGAALAAVLISPMIDALVTPESLAMLMKGENPQIGDTEKNRETQSSSEEADTETSMSYEGLNRFIVMVKQKRSSEDPVKLIYKRHGIISWKLSALRIPFKEDKTFSTPSLESVKSDSFVKAQTELLSTAIEIYMLDTGKYPSQEIGLKSLYSKPADVENWKGPYLKKENWAKDPWGNDYIYRYPGEHGDYDIISYGADGSKGGIGEDADIILQDGTFEENISNVPIQGKESF